MKLEKKDICKKLKGYCTSMECSKDEIMMSKGCGKDATCSCCVAKCIDDGCSEMGGYMVHMKKYCKKGETALKDYTTGHKKCMCCVPDSQTVKPQPEPEPKTTLKPMTYPVTEEPHHTCGEMKISKLFDDMRVLVHDLLEYLMKHEMDKDIIENVEILGLSLQAIEMKIKEEMEDHDDDDDDDDDDDEDDDDDDDM